MLNRRSSILLGRSSNTSILPLLQHAFSSSVAEKLGRSPSTVLRARPELAEGTNGGVLIS
jgi:hypothetical protein